MSIIADRRRFLSYFGSLGLTSTLFPGVLWAQIERDKPPTITKDMLREAATVAGVTFNDHELDAMAKSMNGPESEITKIHAIDLPNSVAPPIYFNPVLPGMKIDRTQRAPQLSKPPQVQRPANLEDVAFWPVTHLAELIRTKQVKSVELTELYLDRLTRHNAKLLCAVTITKDRALKHAREADRQIAAGTYKGPLHGIPYGVKDLLAVKGYPTTWGAAPFKTRIIDEDATVVTRLDAAGAVLVAKLTTGELALDDVWFGGQTKNPWDLSMGSQGSSAGPASATSAGLVGFAIGTETGGSIVEPSGICGVTGHRPTFGRVSRYGAMTLAWSLDKIGPMCRAVEDCALVLQAIQGPDQKDLALQSVPFNWDAQLDIRKLRVGYLKAAFDHTNQTPKTDANDTAALEKLRSLGITLHEVALPKHADLPLTAIMWSEANAALKDPIRVQPTDLVRQDRVASQNSYRLLPAAEYLDANRIRGLLMQEMAKVLADIDVYVVPFDYGDYTPNPVATANTTVTNLTGHPCVVVPHGFNEKGNPTSLTFVGQIFGEAKMLALAKTYQDATDWHKQHPKLFIS